MSVAKAQEQISSREFAEWIAYSTIEPFGEERADLRAGIIASVIANVNRGKGHAPYKPRDFMPTFGESRRQSAQEIIARLKAFAAAHNAAIKGKS